MHDLEFLPFELFTVLGGLKVVFFICQDLPRALTRSFTETPCSSGGISARRLSTLSGGGGLCPDPPD